MLQMISINISIMLYLVFAIVWFNFFKNRLFLIDANDKKMYANESVFLGILVVIISIFWIIAVPIVHKYCVEK